MLTRILTSIALIGVSFLFCSNTDCATEFNEDVDVIMSINNSDKAGCHIFAYPLLQHCVLSADLDMQDDLEAASEDYNCCVGLIDC